MSQTATQQPGRALTFNPDRLLALFHDGRHEALADELLRILDHFTTTEYNDSTPHTRHVVNVICKHFLYLMTQPDFVVDRDRMLRFIALNHVIANVVAMSAFDTTDPWLEILLTQPDNLLKVLALYNPRCTTRIDRKALFAADPAAASTWYFCFYRLYRTAPAEENALAHLREHLEFAAHAGDALDVAVNVAHEAYFGATYIDAERDHLIKRHINRTLQAWPGLRAAIDCRPDPRKIAVLTATWFPGHSVYRCMHDFVARLAQDHELTLFHLGDDNAAVDGRLFAGGVKRFALTGMPDLSQFTPNDFALAFYPDIGLSLESVILSNVRIAPVQVCGYGHPASTRGSKIDYWLGGRDVESVERAQRNYSERLVLIPGAGVAPLRPAIPRTSSTPPDGAIRIGCSWYAQKVNAPLLALLERILERTAHGVHFVVFPGKAPRANGMVPFRSALQKRLGRENVTVHPNLDYPTYMAELAGCHFCLEPWPFGGYTTVIDALWVGRPVISIKGSRFFNRAGAYLLERAGLDELVVDSPHAWVDAAVRLAGEPARVAALSAKLAETDLDDAIFSEDGSDAFHRAITYLIENHDALASSGERSPIVIDR